MYFEKQTKCDIVRTIHTEFFYFFIDARMPGRNTLVGENTWKKTHVQLLIFSLPLRSIWCIEAEKSNNVWRLVYTYYVGTCSLFLV